ncbi:hypothetical protein MNBD_BACTEROID06-328 [hydrothermal vent metagenome]|uniref:Uncharacterized protein n=1 Tax=hydrothermal vent metagenome TaxID=652676 RepID=A0A3B0UIB7_9ZZZZ
MAIQQEIGEKGEFLAAQYLQKIGFLIITKNYRAGKSEIDLVCKDQETLVFVEVKTRTNRSFGNPESFVNEAKAAKVIEGAETYIIENNWKGAVRFDIVSVLIMNGETEIEHFIDAFY